MILSSSNQKVLKQFIKINFFIFLIVNTGNFAQLGYQIFGGKVLIPSDYGILASTNSLIGILALPLAIIFNFAVRVLIQKKTSLSKIKFTNFFNIFNSYVVIFGFLVIFIIILFQDVFKNILFIDSFEIILIMAFTIFFNLLALPFIALNQSLKRYKLVSAIGSAHHFFRLFLFIAIYFMFTKSYLSGLYANLYSFVIVAIIIILTVKNDYKIRFKFDFNKYKKFKIKNIVKLNYENILNFKSASISTFFITLMTGVDIVIFRNLFPNDLSGFYSAISTIAKIPLFLSAITFTYFLTESTYNYFQNKKSFTILFYNLLTNFFIFLVFILLFYFFGEEVLTFLFNKNYSQFSKELYFLTFSFAFIGFIKIIVLYLFSINDNNYAVPLFVGMMIVLFLCFKSTSFIEFINFMVFGYLVLFLFMIFYIFRHKLLS